MMPEWLVYTIMVLSVGFGAASVAGHLAQLFGWL